MNATDVADTALYRAVNEWARCRFPLAVVDGKGNPLSPLVRGERALADALAAHPEARGVAVAAARHYGGVGWTAVDVKHVSQRHARQLADIFDGTRVVDTPDGIRLVPYLLDADRPSWVAADAGDSSAFPSPFLALPEGALVVLPGSRTDDGGAWRWTTWSGTGADFALSFVRELTIVQKSATWYDRDAVLPAGYQHPYKVVRAPS